MADLSATEAVPPGKYLIARTTQGFQVCEMRPDGYLHVWHPNSIGEPAAIRLRDDLAAETCPLALISQTDAFDPAPHVAASYETAVRMLPLMAGHSDDWETALKIADAAPWNRHEYSGTPGAFDADCIPF